MVDVIHVEFHQITVAQNAGLQNFRHKQEFPGVEFALVSQKRRNHDGTFATLDGLEQILDAGQEAASVDGHSGHQIGHGTFSLPIVWHLLG